MHRFTHDTDKSPLDMVLAPTIFVRDPHMRLKKKKLGPNMGLREERRERALARAVEAEGGEYKDTRPLIRKGKKMTIPRKRKKVAPGSTSTLKMIKVHLEKSYKHSFYPF